MGMDSVEVVMCWEESLGIAISDEMVSDIKTPKDSIELLAQLVNATQISSYSLKHRAFNVVRSILINKFGVSRCLIKPNVKISRLFPREKHRKYWKEFQYQLLALGFEVNIGWPLYGFGGSTIEDIVIDIVAMKGIILKSQKDPWTYSQLREIVRCSVTYVNGATDFLDTDEYFGKIGFG